MSIYVIKYTISNCCYNFTKHVVRGVKEPSRAELWLVQAWFIYKRAKLIRPLSIRELFTSLNEPKQAKKISKNTMYKFKLFIKII